MVRFVTGALLSLSLIAAAPPESAHPIHSTLTEITFDASKRTATVRMRAFADDFGTASARWSRAHPRAGAVSPDSAGYDYVVHAFSLESAPSEFVSFERCGVERMGAVVWFCLRAKLDRGLKGVRVGDRVLNDLFDDEINIVQVEDAGHRTSAIFTRNDAAKVLIE